MSLSVLLEAWGYTLIHVCWQGVVLAGLYKLADLGLARHRHAARYVLALGSMVAMVLAAAATMTYEVLRLIPQTVDAASVAWPSANVASGGLSLQTVLPWIEAVWLLGVIALSCRTLTGLYMIHRLKNDAQPVPESLANRFAWVVRQMGLSGKVRLRLHARISGPFVIGAFRSVIYLPASALTRLTPDQLDAVLAHELEHIRRADYAWNLVQTVIETLFFFHPAVWWLGKVVRDQRELCCDDAALKTCTDPLTYATALLSLEEERRAASVAPRGLVMALNGQGSGASLLGRIARMLGESLPATTGLRRSKTRPHAVLALPVTLLVLAALIAPAAQVTASITTPETLASETGPTEAVKVDAHPAHSATVKGNWQETSFYDGEADAADIDPDAIAEQVRAEILAAKADISSSHILDANAIAAQIKSEMEKTRADLESRGIRDHGIDPEMISAQVRADLAAAQVEIAAAQALDAEAIAEQARAEAVRARDIQRERRRLKAPPAPPAEPEGIVETPAPLATPDDIASPSPVAAPKPPAPPAQLSSRLRAAKPLEVQSSIMIDMTPQPNSIAAPAKTLNKLPAATPAPIPHLNTHADVVVKVGPRH